MFGQRPKSRFAAYTALRAQGVYIDPADMDLDFDPPVNEVGATVWRFGTNSGSLTAVSAPDMDNLPVLTLNGTAPTYGAGYLTTASGQHGLTTPFKESEEFTVWGVAKNTGVGSILFDCQSLAQDSGFLLFTDTPGIYNISYAGAASNAHFRAYGGIGANNWYAAGLSGNGREVSLAVFGEAAPQSWVFKTPIEQSQVARNISVGPTTFGPTGTYNAPVTMKMAGYLPYGVSKAELTKILAREAAYQATLSVTVTPQS